MIVTEITDIPPTVITGPADDDHHAERSPGLHLSRIYQSLEEEIVTDAKRRKGSILLPQLEIYRGAGFVWERAFNLALANALAIEEWVRPEEWCCDGIACSPDLISLRDWKLGETKFTWKSSRHLADMTMGGTGALWIWLVQMKGYCYVINTRFSRLFAYFVNGDYKNMQPQWRVLDFEFTEQELRENWQMLKSHARSKGWL